ncbi:transglutaminase family protein [filamentous cyanobacterium LEGE 11480]|uniref:Transglutaminase family protein n=1 Tax=Romeriopsis navalis LEGE 11480 TaxID=2777977 RepID=A0A928VP70_9CYAN|nr:transglutaminase family protein [Romeriopsis navalis]MBE9032233.1 transglutaminase family protein [Romeriopsis navalis LEGE 11480]
MRYKIFHSTTYSYDRPVQLFPHIVRLRPRSDGWQTLQKFDIQITPEPITITHLNDLDGNVLTHMMFDPDSRTESLAVAITSQVETHVDNPFSYQLFPWALQLPFDYPSSLQSQLQPYLRLGQPIDPSAYELAQRLWGESGGTIQDFLFRLNNLIYRSCAQVVRESGQPWPPGLTWLKQSGSCRDYTVLFMEVCRAMGLACRFVSGYQEGDPDMTDRHLHAWPEVYLPGAGWRGYDPTHGLAVADQHIALVASVEPKYAGPIEGGVRSPDGPVQSTLSYKLQLDRLLD